MILNRQLYKLYLNNSKMTDFKKILIEKKSSDKFRDDYYRSI